AAGSLVGGQGIGELGVHHGEPAPAVAAVVAPLEHALVLGDDRGVAHLAAGGGDGEHRPDGGAAGGGVLPVEQVTYVKVVGEAVADGLGGVDDAAAPHGQDEVHALFFAQVDALVHQGQEGVGHHAAQGHIGDAGLLQGGADPVQ